MSDDSDSTLTPKQSVAGDERPSNGTSVNTEKWVRNIPQASTPVTTSVGSDEVFQPNVLEAGVKTAANWKKWTKGLGRGLPWNKEPKPVKRTGSQYSMLPPEEAKKRVCEECLKDPIYFNSFDSTEEEFDEEEETNPQAVKKRDRLSSPDVIQSKRMCDHLRHRDPEKHSRPSSLSTPTLQEPVDPDEGIKTRSHGQTKDSPLPTRPLEYKQYTKRVKQS